MKVVILAGGLGTRLGEEADIKPKPMVEIGGRSLLWHIMKYYAHHSIKEFFIAHDEKLRFSFRPIGYPSALAIYQRLGFRYFANCNRWWPTLAAHQNSKRALQGQGQSLSATAGPFKSVAAAINYAVNVPLRTDPDPYHLRLLRE